MTDHREARIEVTAQGAIGVNGAIFWADSLDIACILVDLHSKRAKLLSTGSNDGIPVVDLCATEDTLYLEEGVDSQAATEITFPDHKGWDLFAADVARYTLSVCLVRSER